MMTDMHATKPAPHFSLLCWIKLVFAVRNERKKLAMLDEAALHDLGLDRPLALSEARRKLWDVPHHWRQ